MRTNRIISYTIAKTLRLKVEGFKPAQWKNKGPETRVLTRRPYMITVVTKFILFSLIYGNFKTSARPARFKLGSFTLRRKVK